MAAHRASVSGQEPVDRDRESRPFIARGRVVSATSGAPLRRVRVAVQSATRIEPLHSDDEGVFAIIVPVAPGGDLRLTKPGFVPQVVSRRDAFSSAPLMVRMIKGAAINGTVMDSLGVPVEGVPIRVRRVAAGTGSPGDGQVATATDDRGEFRAANLPEGRYTVSVGSGSGGRARGGPPDALFGRGQADSGGPARGRGEGRRGSAASNTRSDLPTLDVAVGQEVSTVLTYDPPAAAPQNARPTPTASQTRDAAGAIRGRVLGHDARPLAGATVQLLPLDGEGARRSAVTDASGRFEIAGLSSGRYRLRASRAGLAAVEYGQTRALQSGRVINLAPNQRLAGIDVTMPKGSAVEGTLVDEWGEPVEDATVEVWQARFVDGRTTLSAPANLRSGRTDDRGRYRVYGLLPGSYYVVASEESGRGGSGRGGRVARTRVFYPGTSTVSNAVPVPVDLAQDSSGLDIVFTPALSARIVGRALSASGQPARGRATLAVSQRSGAPALPPQMTGIDASGAFEFADVLPGDYVVQVVAGGGTGRRDGRAGAPQGGRGRAGGSQADGSAGQRGGGAARQGAGPTVQQGGRGSGRGGGAVRGRGAGAAGQRGTVQGSDREFGVQFVTVGEGDVVTVAVTTASGSRINGQVVLEGVGSTETASSFGFAAYPADADASPVSSENALRAVIQDDWTFELADVAGALRFRQTRAPDGWWLKSVDVSGINAVEEPATFGQATGSITVVFASGAGMVEGRVLDDRRQPTSEFSVVVFASAPDRWFNRSPYVRFASASHDGAFLVSGLPPAQYYIAALDRIDGGTDFGDWQNPAVLGALASSARRINVEPGGRVSTELRLIQMARQ